jgi:hypothetical protein
MTSDRPDKSRGPWAEIFVGQYGPITFVLILGMALYAVNQFVVATIMPSVAAELGDVYFYTWSFSLFAVGAIAGSASNKPAPA